jgi:exonuclease III
LAAQIESLMRRAGTAGADAAPALVAGDFNALETSAQIQSLVSPGVGRGWIDAYRQVHPTDPGFTCCVPDVTSGPDQPLERRIDYLCRPRRPASARS